MRLPALKLLLEMGLESRVLRALSEPAVEGVSSVSIKNTSWVERPEVLHNSTVSAYPDIPPAGA